VVDVGGARGSFVQALMEANPKLDHLLSRMTRRS
jgi:hypothetical protein